MESSDSEKKLAAQAAVQVLKNGQIVGLGTGSSAYYAIQEIGRLVSQGLNIRAVATSEKTRALAESLYIPVLEINDVTLIDITIDGADEFTVDRMLIKGGGGALLREKIVASMSTEVIIITDSSKKVDMLGRFKVPLAVVPYAANYVCRQLEKMNGSGALRLASGQPVRTDEQNYIMDADFGLIQDPIALSAQLNNLEGVVAHGLFIHLASKVYMGSGAAVLIF